MKQILALTTLAGIATAAVIASPRLTSAPSEAMVRNGKILVGARCYAPGTSPEYMGEMGYGIWSEPGGARYFTANRWPGTTGTPVNLTYSFPPDGTSVSGQPNVLFATLNAQFGGNTALWKQQIRRAFDEWEAETGNTFTEIADDGANWPGSPGVPGVRGDIRIVSRPIDGGSNTLAFNFFPSGGGDMQLDSSENWAALPGDYIFLRNVVSHEAGHGLGLFHACPTGGQTGGNTKLMEPQYTPAFVGPQVDDRRGVQSLYGDALEANGSTGSATNLNTLGLGVGSPLGLSNLSIHNFGDSDFFRFSVPAGSTISVTVSPAGGSYRNAPQNGDGSCPTGSVINANEQQDLILEILNDLGGVIATFNDNGFGGAESVSGFNLGSAGDFFVRVRSNAAAGGGDAQLYNANFILTAQGVAGDLNGDGCVNATDLGVLLGSWGSSGGLADINGDGNVNASDLAALLGAWGNGC